MLLFAVGLGVLSIVAVGFARSGESGALLARLEFQRAQLQSAPPAPVRMSAERTSHVAQGPISGWVVDDTGGPLAGVQISREDDGGSIAATDAEGAFRFAAPVADGEVLLLEGPKIFPSTFRWQGGGRPARVMASRRMSVTGRVVRGGEPIAGAEVSLRDGSAHVLRTSVTDEGGVVRFTDLAPGVYELWARRESDVSPLVRAVRFGEQSEEVELSLARATTASGRVLADGDLGESAAVVLVPIDVDHAVRHAPLDRHGRFEIPGLPQGRWRVELRAPGHVTSDDYVLEAAGEQASIEIDARRAGAISGIVLDAAGTPVERTTLVLRGRQRGQRIAPSSLSLGARQPRASPLLPASGPRWVHPLARERKLPIRDSRRFGAPRDGVRPAECGQGHCGVDIGQVRGTVVHAASDGVVAAVVAEDRGLAGRYVVLEHRAGLKTFYMHLDAIRTDLEAGDPIRAGEPIGTLGRTGIDRAAPHLHFSMSQKHRGRPWFIDPEPVLQHAVVLPEPVPLNLYTGKESRAPTVIADVRRGAGGPADLAVLGAKALAVFGKPEAPADEFITDQSGRFRIEGVAAGSYVASAFHPELAPGASGPFQVRTGEETSGVIITLSPGVVVHGQVAGPGGPIGGARIVAEEGEGESQREVADVVTDANGRFELRPLVGNLRISVTAYGYGSAARQVKLESRRVLLSRREENFELAMRDSELRAQVLDPDDFPVRGAAVRIVGGPSGNGRTATTDQNGYVYLDALPAGRYEVAVSSSGYPAAQAQVSTDRLEKISLEQGGGVRLELRDAHTRAALPGVLIEARGPAGARTTVRSDGEGIAELSPLTAGRWKIRARLADYVVARRTIEIQAGQEPGAISREEDLELSRGATVAGVVRNEFGERVAGARVWSGHAFTKTDQDGRFRLTDVPTGAVKLLAERDEQRGSLDLELAPGNELVTLDIRLE